MPSHPFFLQPIASTLPVLDKITSPFNGGVDSELFGVKENKKHLSPERCSELRIGWLDLFLLDLFGARWGGISFMISSLSSFFLFFLAGQFFAPLFPFIRPSMF
jgi:hypothetical protein